MSDKDRQEDDPSRPITELLAELRGGNKQAEAQLIPMVYNELHRLARHYMRAERGDHTLQTSALVNEAYLRLVGEHGIDWKNRAHFFGVSAQIMRRILVDHARTRDAQKRGGSLRKISLENAFVYTDEQSWQVVALHEALTKLAQWDERQCRIVELRFFTGLSVEETAEAMSLSPTTVKREFQLAKAWLYGELSQHFSE
ncbi:MAG TPA: sigma-70 family RNA polymerase sigma factor [Candidatus Saccharimonadales bacterium]|jgi:RNA polymerase sigma-70 factor (ECF subfamily)|nr:sigma-70 family RNA polymerase sigma factor [Candidatus Saccharimonadales bacterium]